MLDHVLNSPVCQTLGHNWFHEIPAENSPGATWQKVNIGEKTYHKHLPTGDMYRPDTNAWAAAKTIALLWVGGYYYFGAALGKHVISGMVKTASAIHQIYEDRKALKQQDGFSETRHLKESILGSGEAPSVFKPALSEFKQAVKDAIVFVPLYYTSWSKTILIGSMLYTLYNPHQPRVAMQTVYQYWRRADETKPLPEQIDSLNFGQFFTDLTDGTYSILEIFKLDKLSVVAPSTKDASTEEEVVSGDNDNNTTEEPHDKME